MRIIRQRQGAALLETVLTLPFITLFLIGSSDLVLIYQKKIHLDGLCFRAARAAIVYGDQTDWEDRVNDTIQREIKRDSSLTFLQQNPQIKFIPKTDSQDLHIGQAITVELAATYADPFPFAGGFFSRPDQAMKTTCSLTSEVGKYVKRAE